MKKITILLILTLAILTSSCGGYERPKTKYSIYLPDRRAYSCWFHVNSYKEINGGAIQFTHNGRIIRDTNFEIRINH